MENLKEMTLSEEQFSHLMQRLRFVDADESFVRNSLKLRKLVFDSKPFGLEEHTYLQADNKWSEPSIEGTDWEKALFRRMIETAQNEENATDLLLGLYDIAEEDQDLETQMLIIRGIAQLVLKK